jgi:hypothetical protein
LKIYYHEEVDGRGGEDETESEFAESCVHTFDLAAHVDGAARRKFGPKLVDDFGDLTGDATEIGALYVGVNVEDRLHVGVTNDCRCFGALERDYVAE